MKLYTEETVKFIAKAIYEHDFDHNKTPEELVDELKPIELPSDEDIEQYLNSFPYTKHLDDGQYNDGVIVGAELAIQWMKEQITKTK